MRARAWPAVPLRLRCCARMCWSCVCVWSVACAALVWLLLCRAQAGAVRPMQGVVAPVHSWMPSARCCVICWNILNIALAVGVISMGARVQEALPAEALAAVAAAAAAATALVEADLPVSTTHAL